MSELSARERIILAIDTSDSAEAIRLTKIAKKAGARFVKLGLEISSATSWQFCSSLAADNELDWVADAKLHDIPNTVKNTVRNIRKTAHPPFGITIHTLSGREALKVAQEEAGTIKMLGVTILTSIDAEESAQQFHEDVPNTVMHLARKAVDAGVAGLVCSPLEVGLVKATPETAGLFTMIPGTRSVTAETADQVRVSTPAEAIRNRADLLVIGRQVTGDPEPVTAYEAVVAEVEGAS